MGKLMFINLIIFETNFELALQLLVLLAFGDSILLISILIRFLLTEIFVSLAVVLCELK